MTEPPDEAEPSASQAPPPFGLDYFAANEPDRRQSRAAVFWSAWLALGWLPYLCGVVNALVVAQSYSPLARQSHNIGAVLFMGLGLAMSLAGLVGFARRRHWTGAAAALLLLLLQASLAACLAASSF